MDPFCLERSRIEASSCDAGTSELPEAVFGQRKYGKFSSKAGRYLFMVFLYIGQLWVISKEAVWRFPKMGLPPVIIRL